MFCINFGKSRKKKLSSCLDLLNRIICSLKMGIYVSIRLITMGGFKDISTKSLYSVG
jgi:hypothetical protein